ncbi:hypothetical protein [Candidatus Methylacidithermus pantelleriae]|nr:hypothetical protein [Candidatus Methylacidithermus pantelleriae]
MGEAFLLDAFFGFVLLSRGAVGKIRANASQKTYRAVLETVFLLHLAFAYCQFSHSMPGMPS